MFGSLESVLVCKAAGSTVDPCPAGQAPAIVSAYILDVSAQSGMDAALAPIDFAQASVFWGLAFALVLAVWSLAHLFRQVNRAIR
jgi:hypothetical protein